MISVGQESLTAEDTEDAEDAERRRRAKKIVSDSKSQI
jgi:hypothetical protein